jgi:DNA-binding transcriptional MerR regulator/uncharacterized protein (DUF433 family)
MAPMESPATPALGTGIYTVAEAARLLQVSPQKLARWAEGYVFERYGELRRSGPVIDRGGAAPGLFTFYDLVELFFVREFRKAKVDLPLIRKAAQVLRDEWQTPYPFALKKIAELDRKLIHKEQLRTILGKQAVFEFGRGFFKDFDFDEQGLAAAWHPLTKGKLIVLDPKRSFGAPIDVRSGVRTDVLYRLYKAEDGDIEAVAGWYEVEPEAVAQAVEFEEKWRQSA